MVFGPMMDAKLLFLYSTVFRWKFIIILLAALFVLTGGLSILAETVYENYWQSAQP